MAGGLISGKRRRLEEKKIKEALCINAMNPKELMNLEKGFEINQCWNEFNPQIRNIALKKEGNKTEFSRAYAFQKFAFSFDC